MKVYREETYGGWYDVDETVPHLAEEKLEKLIGEGKENPPEESVTSINVAVVDNGNPQYQIMGGKIDAMSDDEKRFYLWHLMRFFYKRELMNEKQKYADNDSTVEQINRLLNNVEEIDTLLTYEIY